MNILCVFGDLHRQRQNVDLCECQIIPAGFFIIITQLDTRLFTEMHLKRAKLAMMNIAELKKEKTPDIVNEVFKSHPFSNFKIFLTKSLPFPLDSHQCRH